MSRASGETGSPEGGRSECSPRQDGRYPILDRGGNLGTSIGDVEVHFAPDPVLRKVDARLDGEAGARDEPSFVPSLQVVEVGAVAVDLPAHTVPRPVDEEPLVPAVADEGSRHRTGHSVGREVHGNGANLDN